MFIRLWPHRHHRAPPASAFIYLLDLRIRYRVRHHRSRTMATATLTWTPPTTRADGSPLPADQIAGTKVFNGDREIGVVDGAGGSFTTGDLTPGEHSFTVIVQDKTGAVSAPSNTATATIAAAAPAAVSDLKATVNT
jgi:hypothetical protein